MGGCVWRNTTGWTTDTCGVGGMIINVSGWVVKNIGGYLFYGIVIGVNDCATFLVFYDSKLIAYMQT